MNNRHEVEPQISKDELKALVLSGETTYKDDIAIITFEECEAYRSDGVKLEQESQLVWFWDVKSCDPTLSAGSHDAADTLDSAISDAYEMYLWVCFNCSVAQVAAEIVADGRWRRADDYRNDIFVRGNATWDLSTGELYDAYGHVLGSPETLAEAEAICTNHHLYGF